MRTKALPKLVAVRVGAERPWSFREDYRRVVRRHNLRTVVAFTLLLGLFIGALVFLGPWIQLLPTGLRGALAGALFISGFAVLVGVMLWHARKDCERFHLLCPSCGKALYGARRMEAWLDGDTQSIGFCPYCRQAIQCARPGVALADPVAGAPIPRAAWERWSRISRRRMAVFTTLGILAWVVVICGRRALGTAGMPPGDAHLWTTFSFSSIGGVWLAFGVWMSMSSGAASRKAGISCSRCNGSLTAGRAVCEISKDPLRLTCLSCGTLMRVEA